MWEIIGKFVLVCLLSVCIMLITLTGISLYSGVGLFTFTLDLHISCGLLFILLALIHLINRKRKFLKLYTQFYDLMSHNRYPSYCNLDRLLLTFEKVSPQMLSDGLQLPLQLLINELNKGNIIIADPQQSLRNIVGNNDEKLFSAITIAMQLRFNSNR